MNTQFIAVLLEVFHYTVSNGILFLNYRCTNWWDRQNSFYRLVKKLFSRAIFEEKDMISELKTADLSSFI